MESSKQFYTKLTPEGLAVRKKDAWTKKEFSYLKRILSKKDKILDLGCGYGRFTIPLAKSGLNIEGIDITPSLIQQAKKLAKIERLKIKFKVGDMRNLPYKKDNFNSIICMWSVFMELIKKKDQIKAIKEMIRVLKGGGFAFIELPSPYKIGSKIEDTKAGDKVIVGKDNILRGKLSNIEIMPTYNHDKNNLTKLMKISKIKKFKIYIDEFGGRDRLFLKFWKE